MKFRIILLAAFCVVVHPGLTADASELQIDPSRSEIKVEVATSVSSFTAKLERFDARIECRTNADLPDAATVSFDFKNLDTGIKLRNEHMLTWLGYPPNTNGVFRLQAWRQAGTNTVATGKLTVHGVTQSIEMPVRVVHANEQYEINGMASLDYRDFELPLIRKALLFKVGPHITVTFHLSGLLKPSQ